MLRSNLEAADLWSATLADADLQGAKLHEANLSGADLMGANLSGAINLSSEQLSGCESLCGSMLDPQLRREIESSTPSLFERVDD